jgi:hypothetical protein
MGLGDSILSSFHNNSVNPSNQAPNPYSDNSVKSAMTIRPVTGELVINSRIRRLFFPD